VENADEQETAVHFLADFFAEEGTLQVGQDSGGCHGMEWWSGGIRKVRFNLAVAPI
jgi:hypothetical protein